MSVYWWIKGNWFAHQDSEVSEILEIGKEMIFPFDWIYKINLEKDIYHD